MVTAAGIAVRRRRGARNGADGQTTDASEVRDNLCMLAGDGRECCRWRAVTSQKFGRHAKARPTTSVIGRFSASRQDTYPTKTPHRQTATCPPLTPARAKNRIPPPCRALSPSSASRRSWSSPSTMARASSPSTTRTHTRLRASTPTSPAR